MNDKEMALRKYRECLEAAEATRHLADLALLNARLAAGASVDAAEWWLETEQIRLKMLKAIG
jgi:hypothetical protein